jgi:CheY-like chemotaxis protein
MFSLHRHESPIPPNTVLIVDDEPMLRAVAARQLKTAGFDVIEAENGADAVTQFFRHQTSIVGMVLDLMMPESDVRYRPVGEPEVTVLIKPIEGSTIVRELRRLIDGE